MINRALVIDKLDLSARTFNRVLNITRTIPDLEGEKKIQVNHISKAIQRMAHQLVL